MSSKGMLPKKFPSVAGFNEPDFFGCYSGRWCPWLLNGDDFAVDIDGDEFAVRHGECAQVHCRCRSKLEPTRCVISCVVVASILQRRFRKQLADREENTMA
jgi:hypothetical protein